MATATPVYSNGTWGSVVGANLNGVYAPRPVEGVLRTEEYTVENATIELTCPEPGYDPLVLQLGNKTFSRQVPDVSPIWAQWEASNLLPSLADVAEPDSVKLPRLKTEKQAALDAAWKAAEATGVQVNDIHFGIAQGDVSLLTGAFVLAQTAVNLGAASADGPFTLIDVSGQSHSFTFAELTQTMLLYGNARAAWSKDYADAKAAIEAASTVAQINAVTVPDFE
jgi:hypothetical protein